MSYDGSHFICKKHKKETTYCDIDLKWVCKICEIEEENQ